LFDYITICVDDCAMHIDPTIRTQLAAARLHDQLARAERERLVRGVRGEHAWRLAVVRLAARGLRVEREIEFRVARAGR
jgi:hypothetical protein